MPRLRACSPTGSRYRLGTTLSCPLHSFLLPRLSRLVCPAPFPRPGCRTSPLASEGMTSQPAPAAARGESSLRRLLLDERRAAAVTHIEHVPARRGTAVDWPEWAAPLLVSRLQAAGIERPWQHQLAAATA